MSEDIANLRNLGPVSASMILQVGIKDSKELLRQDAVDVYLLLKLFGFKVNHNMLWALYGAINDVDWREIKDSDKKKLKKRLKDAEANK